MIVLSEQDRSNVLVLTEAAKARLAELSRKRKILFLTVKSNGCAGNTISLETIESYEIGQFDVWVEIYPASSGKDNVAMVVDGDNLDTINGVTVDYVSDKLGGRFAFFRGDYVFCGCGESFNCKTEGLGDEQEH